MTSSSIVSSLGTDVGMLRENLVSKRRGISFQHRFADRIKSPMGEIPWDSLGICKIDPNDSDRYLLEGSRLVMDDLLQGSTKIEITPRARIGLFVGTTTCGVSGFFALAKQLGSSDRIPGALFNASMQQAWLGKKLAEEFAIKGPVYTFSSSCAASAQALVMAHDAVSMGWIDAAVVLGADILNPVTIFGFDALQLLDNDYCRPFAATRAGINLSEAIVGVVLERGFSETSDTSTRIRAFAGLSEAHHMTQPAPEGLWMRNCMTKALGRSNLTPEEIDVINPHGTGTLANDEMESQAITQIFGSTERMIPTKASTGHALGASGLFEIVILSLLMEQRQKNGANGQNVRGLKNSFGFGGANMSIILERGCL